MTSAKCRRPCSWSRPHAGLLWPYLEASQGNGLGRRAGWRLDGNDQALLADDDQLQGCLRDRGAVRQQAQQAAQDAQAGQPQVVRL